MFGIVAGGMTSCTSDNVSDLPAAVPTRLVFIVAPVRAEAGVAFTPAPRVAVQDQFGNTHPAGTTAITVTLAANPAGLTLTGTTTVNSVDGVATFSDLHIDRSGSDYTLFATAPGLTGASTHAFSTSLTFTALSAGGLHTCGVSVSGFMYCWGYNEAGQLGDGTTTHRPIPTRVAGNVRFAQVSAGYDHTCGITPEAAAYCWGGNDRNQVGDGGFGKRLLPTAVAGGHAFAQVSAGYEATCAITAGRAAYCWGKNDVGQLGDSTTQQRATPTPVAGGLSFKQIYGLTHTCGISTANDAYCWGGNREGQLGDGAPTTVRSRPTQVAASATFTAVTTGYSRSCGLTTTGEVYCWGETWGLDPKAIGGTLRFAQLDGGSTHGCALTTAGTAYCWGENQYGKLGDGTDVGRAAPTPVSGGLTFAVLTAGNAHTCGITTDKVTYCWGYNFYGVLGDGTTTHRMTPVRIVQ